MNKSFSDKEFLFSALNSKNYIILFILWPFLTFLLALKNYSQKESKKVVYFFLIYYGLTFTVGNIGVDAERYALQLKSYAELPFSDFFNVFGRLYTDTTVDIVAPFVNFVVSRFTSFYGVLFAVWAAIFGFFYIKSINLLHNRFRVNPGWNTMIIMVFFIVLLPITTINGVRMWTAAWIFFYGAYHVILYRDTKYLILALGSSLVHWSFFSANAVLLIYFFAGNRNFIYLPIALISFILPQLISPVFHSMALRLGGPFQDRYEGYSSEGYRLGIQEMDQNASWFLTLGNNLVFYYLLLAMIVIQLRYGHLMKEKAERNLFSFLLLFLSFVNFGNSIPSFGSRFQLVFFLFATLYVFLFYVKLPMTRVNLLTWIGLFPMLLYAAIMFRMGSESISVLIFAPGLGLPLIAPGISIASYLFY